MTKYKVGTRINLKKNDNRDDILAIGVWFVLIPALLLFV